MKRDPFAPLWAGLVEQLTGPFAFAWEPERLSLRQWAERGCVLHVVAPLLPSDTVAICPTDPEWSDPDVEEDCGGPSSMFDVWPELRGHLPRDGRLRAVATLGGMDERHEVRVIDLDTLVMEPPVQVVAFGQKAPRGAA